MAPVTEVNSGKHGLLLVPL